MGAGTAKVARTAAVNAVNTSLTARETVSMPETSDTYTVMRAFGGLSDQTWSLYVQLAAMAFSLGLGFIRRSWNAIWVALAVGLLANIVGQVLIAGGGEGALVGMVILPAYCGMLALMGWAAGRLLLPARRKHSAEAL